MVGSLTCFGCSRDGKAVYNYETDTRLTSSVWHSDGAPTLPFFPACSSIGTDNVSQSRTKSSRPASLCSSSSTRQPREATRATPIRGAFARRFSQSCCIVLTTFCSRGAYNHLSPNFRAYLETLSAVHSGVEQAEFSRNGNRGGIVKREPVENVHPIVRVHPVTGEKALFVNRQFTRRIVGLKQEESDAILNLLYLHIERGTDFQVRLRHRPRTVIAWDVRSLDSLPPLLSSLTLLATAEPYHGSHSHCRLCQRWCSSSRCAYHAAGGASVHLRRTSLTRSICPFIVYGSTLLMPALRSSFRTRLRKTSTLPRSEPPLSAPCASRRRGHNPCSMSTWQRWVFPRA